MKLSDFISKQQFACIALNVETGNESEFFKKKLIELTKIFETMPKTYEQDGKGDEAIVYLHYFTSGCDWFITERDSEPEQLQAYGLACIQCDELGYISLVNVLRIGAELDLHWTPKTLGEVKTERVKPSQRKEHITALMNSAMCDHPEATNEELKKHYALLNSKSDLELENMVLINC